MAAVTPAVQAEIDATTRKAVRAHVITGSAAKVINAATGPIAVAAITSWRCQGMKRDEITAAIDEKIGGTTTDAAMFAAMLYAAAWRGMQADFRAKFGYDMR